MTFEELTPEEFNAKYGPKALQDATPAKMGKGKAGAVDYLVWLIEASGLPAPVRELRFAPPRRWRFDLAWPDHMIALEVDGGTYGRSVRCHNCKQIVKRRTKAGKLISVREGGRHNTGQGHEKDAEKTNAAALLGWRVLRVIPGWVEDGRALALVEEALLDVEIF